MSSYILMLICLSICNSAFSKGLPQRPQPKATCQAVQVGVYYESFNTDSINFIINQFTQLGNTFHSIARLDFVPWGRTTYNDADNTFSCTNGPEECHADRIHACASYLYPKTPKELLQFIRCTVQHPQWKTNSAQAANECANQVDGWVDAYPEIEFCSILNDTTDTGVFLNMRDKTALLDPPLTNVPIVTINGNQNTNAVTNLVNVVNNEFYTQDCPLMCENAVKVGFYYESHDATAINFITNQFANMGDAFYLITDLDFVPWGRTTYNQADNSFTCNGGPEECHADRIHACAEYLHTDNPQQLLQFIQCTVAHPDWMTNSANAANQCANQVDGWVDAYPQIEACSVLNDTTDIGVFLNMREKTALLDPPYNNAPIVTINGNQSTAALTDLVNIINNTYFTRDCMCSAIDVGVYYESFDQNTLNFVVSQFVSIDASHTQYLNVDWVPWGRATYDQASNTFTCTNGPEECHGDRLHACASALHSDTPKQVFQFILCTVQHALWKTNPAEAANQCANTATDWVDAYPDLEFCSVLNDTTDVNIFLRMRDKTNALNPPFSTVPTITVKRQPNSDAVTNLISYVNQELSAQGCTDLLPTPRPIVSTTPNLQCKAIDIGVYYESFDQNTLNFVTSQFVSIDASHIQYLNVDWVPWGRTQYNADTNTFTCTNGPEECHGDRLHACASVLHSDTPKQVYQFILCTVQHALWKTNPAEAGNQCANQATDWIDAWFDLEYCSVLNDTTDINIFLGMRNKTNALNPAFTTVPTITIQGQQDSNAVNNLISIVNDALSAQGCTDLLPTPKPGDTTTTVQPGGSTATNTPQPGTSPTPSTTTGDGSNLISNKWFTLLIVMLAFLWTKK